MKWNEVYNADGVGVGLGFVILCGVVRPGLRHLAALGKIKIGGPSTSAPTSDFSKKKMHMKTHMCWVYMFFKHNFCVKPYVSRKPRRDPSNRRLNVHVLYLRHCQESSSQPVPSQAGDDATRPQWRTCRILHDVVPQSPKILPKPNFARSFRSKAYINRAKYFFNRFTRVSLARGQTSPFSGQTVAGHYNCWLPYNCDPAFGAFQYIWRVIF